MPENKIMVCVTGQKNCARLIHEGAQIATAQGGTLDVIHVATEHSAFLGSNTQQEADALQYLFHCAAEVGAQMCVLRSENALNTLVKYAKDNAITCAVLGIGQGARALHFADTLRQHLPGVDIHPVPAAE